MQGLFFLPRINRFMNSRGEVVNDTSKIFDTWQLDNWKKNGGYSDYVLAKDGNIWELFYMFPPETDEDIVDEAYRDDSGGSKLEKIL